MQVLELLAESIGQTGKAPHAQPLAKFGHQGHGIVTGALADAIDRNKLGFRVNRIKRPLAEQKGK